MSKRTKLIWIVVVVVLAIVAVKLGGGMLWSALLAMHGKR